MSNKPPRKIGTQTIGKGQPPLFLPDIDVYFKQDIAGAYRLIDSLMDAGLKTLKGALLHDPKICLKSGDVSYFIQGAGNFIENYRQVIERHVVPLEDLRRIYMDARARGMELVLSVYDPEGLELALELDVAAIKMPSSNIVHAPLIRDAASCSKPLIIDTGRSTIEEIDRAVRWSKEAGAEFIVLQHSPPGPPAGVEEQNMNMMLDIGVRHDCYDGLSDHFAGIDMMLVAAVLDADVIEKGICFDNASADIDIAHALPISQVGDAVNMMGKLHSSLGDRQRKLPSSRPVPPDRMGAVAKTDLQAGTVITRELIRFAFPQIGYPVEKWDEMAGKVLKVSVVAGQPITDEHF